MVGGGRDIERGGEKNQDSSLKARADRRNARERHEKSYDAARAACNSGTESQSDACRDKARTYSGIPACDPALNDAIAGDAIDPERGNCTADSWREYWSCFRL